MNHIARTGLPREVIEGDLKIEGNRQALTDFMELLNTFPFWFNIVTP